MQNAFERRIKQHIKAPVHSFRAGAHTGFENSLAKELAMLGIKECEAQNGAVCLKAKLENVWQAIALSHCARSFEMKIAEFHCENFGKLENKIKSIAWELYLPQAAELKIDVKSEKSRLYHKGAVSERVRACVAERVEVAVEGQAATVNKLHIRFKNDTCSIWLDLCGEALHIRGERWVEDAPMQETLAASILLQADFARHEKLIDPMAGSGVFSLEAAKWRSNSAITLNRTFDFIKMPAFREAAFNNFLRKAKSPFALNEYENFEILCSDKSEKAVKTIRHNADALNAAYMQIKRADFFSLSPSKNALLVLNPPYGKRLGREKNLYPEIARKIEKDFSECAIAVVCPEREAHNFENALKGRALSKICSYNGGLRVCIFLD